MAESTTLARPYANAIFELAKEAERVAECGRMLDALAMAGGAPEVKRLVASPTVSAPEKSHQLISLLDPGEVIEVVRRFVDLLASNRRLPLLPEINQLFKQRQAEEMKTMEVTVTTAVPMSEAERDSFEQSLTNRFKKRIEMSTAVDPQLLGGALIHAEDTVLDGTVRGKLQKLQEALKRA